MSGGTCGHANERTGVGAKIRRNPLLIVFIGNYPPPNRNRLPSVPATIEISKGTQQSSERNRAWAYRLTGN